MSDPVYTGPLADGKIPIGPLTDYKTGLQQYDDDMFIGSLVWYSVPTSVSIQFNEFSKKIIEVFGAFEEDMQLPLRRAPRPHDVFKRACKNVGVIKLDYTPPPVGDEEPLGHTNRYRIHDAGSDAYGIYREVVKEVLDKEGHTLSHSTIGKFTFMRAASEVEGLCYVDLGPQDREIWDIINEMVQDYYDVNRHRITGSGIRYIILDILNDVLKSYTARSSGGVYFVKKDFGKYLEPLSSMLASITNDDATERVQFHFLPLIDDQKQREMLKEAFTADVSQRFNEISSEVAGILNSGKKVTSSRFATLHTKFTDVKTLIAEQQELLNDGLDGANMAGKVLNKQMLKLVSNVG